VLLVPPTQCKESGMFITDPRFLILILSHPDPGSRISDPGFNKVKGEDNFCLTFLVSHKFHKVENYFSTFYPKFYPILVLFTQNIATMLSKIWVEYPGSETRDPESGSRGQNCTVRSGSRIPNTAPPI
jgi:hypothetical protein